MTTEDKGQSLTEATEDRLSMEQLAIALMSEAREFYRLEYVTTDRSMAVWLRQKGDQLAGWASDVRQLGARHALAVLALTTELVAEKSERREMAAKLRHIQDIVDEEHARDTEAWALGFGRIMEAFDD